MHYTLEKYYGSKSRFDCPNCKSKKTFTRYINVELNSYLADNVGRCNKIDKCGYHFKPKDYFVKNGVIKYIGSKKSLDKLKPMQMFTIPIKQLDSTLRNYDNNNFALILLKLFGYESAVKLLTLYEIGTSKKWNGATIFWQIDAEGRARTGKIMLYDINTYKRVKIPYEHISWVHSGILETNTHEIRQCFFGEHLINQFILKPVAIVESEKTAVICSYFLPDFNWLSAGNINGLSVDKFKVLKGRKVVLFPDLSKGYDIWHQKAKELDHLAEVSVSDYLQRIATSDQKAKGLDLADYLISTITKM